MAHQQLSSKLVSLSTKRCKRLVPLYSLSQRRQASDLSTPNKISKHATPLPNQSPDKLDPSNEAYSSLHIPGPSEEIINSFNPAERARNRKVQLPPGRYQFRPPKYYRGPLHPHQPPPRHYPESREFVPGPFSLPRLRQTYESTIRQDLMALYYVHTPPGFRRPPPPPRLRSWDDSSPYHKNRPLRGPQGAPALPLLRRPVTFNNVPCLDRITVSSVVRDASTDSAYLHVAGMVLQAISGIRAKVHLAKRSFSIGRSTFNQRAGKPIAVSVDMQGEAMYDFMAKLVDVVLPRIKDWKGIPGSSGDGSGNIGFRMSGEIVGGFPEIEVNYDAYPPKMIPGIDVIVHTTASTDKNGRLLLASMGLPFYGKHVN